jgi:hypothetical protein
MKEGGTVSEELPQIKRLPEEDILFWLHVPRTAGTAINRALEDALGPRMLYDQAVANDAAAAGEPYEAYLRSRPALYVGVRLIAGHMRVDDALVRLAPRPAAFARVVREPVARAVSLYEYVRHTPGHGSHAAMRPLTLFHAIQALPNMRDSVVCAQIIQLFHTHGGVAIARRVATGRYLIGRHDRLDLFWQALERLLGIAAPPGRANDSATLARNSPLPPPAAEPDFAQALAAIQDYSAHEIAYYARMPPLILSPALRQG